MEQTNKNSILKQIGASLKKLRTERNIEIKAIAKDLHLTPQAYGNIENGKTDISISRVLELATYYKVSYSQILNLENQNVYNNSSYNNQHGINLIQGGENIFNTDAELVKVLKEENKYLKEQNHLLIKKIK